MTDIDAGRLLDTLRGRQAELINDLSAWVRIPSVAGAAEHETYVQRSAEWLADTLQTTGFPVVELWPAGSSVAVWAEWCSAPEAPTILIYSHHDVRTAAAEGWEQCPPFEPTVRDGRLYGRGASDAKGQVLAHVWAFAALRACGSLSPPVNVKLLIEGQEEIGSPDLAELLDKQGDRLAADLVMLTDTMTWSAERPAVCVRGRGLMHAELEVHGPVEDVHAGLVSGTAPNSATVLAEVLAALHDSTGRVTLPDFYADVREASAEDLADFAQTANDEADWLRRTGTRSVQGEAGRSLAERLWTRPSADVVAIRAGDLDPPLSGTLPATATALLQFALVPEQDPDRIAQSLREWVAAVMPSGVEYDLSLPRTTDQPAYATPAGHPALALLQSAMSQAWGHPVGRMGNSGSAPTALLAGRTRAPVVFFGTGLPEDRWHADDESVHVATLLRGAATLAVFWQSLAEHGLPANDAP
jgi:acetylornithine deacetylase/succinyl-diaminopimelate desuccinylase-like protein